MFRWQSSEPEIRRVPELFQATVFTWRHREVLGWKEEVSLLI